MSFADLRKRVVGALDKHAVIYALRFPNQKSGTLVIDLDAAPANLARAREALVGVRGRGPWAELAGWLASEPRTPQHSAGGVLLAAAALEAPAATVTDEDALRAAIVEHPDDDAPRLVYADLLTARGDPHGELIVLQCRQAAGDATEAVRERIAAMLRAGWKAYAGELAPYTHEGGFRRGFVDEVRMTVPAFEKHGARVFATWPVQALAIEEDDLDVEGFARLATIPTLARVRRLRITQGYNLRKRVPIAALAKSPHFGQLEELELTGCGESATDWREMFGKLVAPRLRSLRLLHTYASASICGALATNPSLAGLESLWADYYGTVDTKDRTRDGYAMLATHRALAQLAIENNPHATDATLAPFFSAQARTRLHSLHLTRTKITDALLREIARSPTAGALRVVELDEAGDITIEGIRALVGAAHRLTRLAVRAYEWPAETMAAYEQVIAGLAARNGAASAI